MPELPEVEVVRRGVAGAAVGRTVRDVVARVPKLRWPIPPALRELLAGHAVRAAERRGKYLLLAFDHGWLIVHLGMSGSLSLAAPGSPPRTHDHLDLVLDDGAVLRLHDPRRFGAVLWHPREDGPVEAHPLLARLGVEPFSEAFNAELLHAATRGRTASVKQALLAGDVVVGVGNIYASEALFRAGIRPTTRAGRVRLPRWRRLAEAIRATLSEAIDKGGSSLRDFVGTHGESGGFQVDCYVYARAGQPCRVCGTPIRAIRQQQRSTYYCPACQR
jgi:formamidopyrimidine-DNA glycosylase